MTLNETSTRLYKAIVPFALNMVPNGREKPESFNVAKGDEMEFDGLYVNFKGIVGTARSLSSVLGEWLKEQKGAAPLGKVMQDPGKPSLVTKSDSVIERPGKSRANIVHYEDNEVSRTRAGTSSNNNHGVLIDSSVKKGSRNVQVLADEQNVAKATSYEASGERTSTKGNVRVARKVVSESDQQQEVHKTIVSARATPANVGPTEVTSRTKVSEAAVYEEQEVRQVSASAKQPSRTDIGSSTQTRQASSVGARTVTGNRQLETQDTEYNGRTHAESSQSVRRIPTVESDDQGGVVVGAVRRTKASSVIDGIAIKTSVGAEQRFEKPGVTVTGSNNGDAIIMAKKATITASGPVIDADDEIPEIDVDAIQISRLAELEVDGKSWDELSWQAKVKFMQSCEDRELLEEIAASKQPQAVRKAATARLSELG